MRKKLDRDVKQILKALQEQYRPSHSEARIDAYRYNAAFIHARVIDSGYAGKSLVERDKELWVILHHLPEETRAEIQVLLLLTPQETQTSLMNLEFEDPTPTRL